MLTPMIMNGEGQMVPAEKKGGIWVPMKGKELVYGKDGMKLESVESKPKEE